jgi:hypothetical protein
MTDCGSDRRSYLGTTRLHRACQTGATAYPVRICQAFRKSHRNDKWSFPACARRSDRPRKALFITSSDGESPARQSAIVRASCSRWRSYRTMRNFSLGTQQRTKSIASWIAGWSRFAVSLSGCRMLMIMKFAEHALRRHRSPQGPAPRNSYPIP